ncbi:MAG: hypothetical protein IH587_05925 [Anaerolineae bacterium]|nr:hypothetical protein [Anaerolineae bacterium]
MISLSGSSKSQPTVTEIARKVQDEREIAIETTSTGHAFAVTGKESDTALTYTVDLTSYPYCKGAFARVLGNVLTIRLATHPKGNPGQIIYLKTEVVLPRHARRTRPTTIRDSATLTVTLPK